MFVAHVSDPSTLRPVTTQYNGRSTASVQPAVEPIVDPTVQPIVGPTVQHSLTYAMTTPYSCIQYYQLQYGQ